MGKVVKISGPLVVGSEMLGSKMYDVVKVGKDKIIGEIIQLESDKAVIQVYEDTGGMRPGEPIKSEGTPLSVELGPGIITNIFDGVQRPLESIRAKSGAFIPKGIEVQSLDSKKKWEFVVEKGVSKGTKVEEGDILGHVDETPLVKHYIMVPKGVSGKIASISSGKHTVDDTIAQIETHHGKVSMTMVQKRPVREAGKYIEKLQSDVPLITGQRVIDFFFPVAKGGAAAIPGPFGAAKRSSPTSLQSGLMLTCSICRMRGARKRDDRSAYRIPRAQGPESRKAAYGTNCAYRKHKQHAGSCKRGERYTLE